MTSILNPFTGKQVKPASMRRYLKRHNQGAPQVVELLATTVSVDKIFNPDTQRFVNRTGRVGKRIIAVQLQARLDEELRAQVLEQENQIRLTRENEIRIIEATEEAELEEFLASENNASKMIRHIDIQTLMRILERQDGSKHYVIRAGTQFYTLSPAFLSKYMEILETNERTDADAPDAYDAMRNAIFDRDLKLSITVFEKKREAVRGAFFKYTHNTPFDLSRYQVYTEYTNDQTENCLIYTLRLLGIDENKLNVARTYVIGGSVARSKLNDLCDDLDICISLTTPKDLVYRIVNYGDKTKPKLNIGLIDGHYFINDTTNISKDGLEYWKTIKDGNYLYSKSRHTPSGLKSFQLINFMHNNKTEYLTELVGHYAMLATLDGNKAYVEPNELITENKGKRHGGRTKEEIHMQKILDESNIESKSNTHDNDEEYWDAGRFDCRIFFDCETSTDGGIHTPYLYCLTFKSKNRSGNKSFVGPDCGYEMLNWVRNNFKKPLLIGHNVSYDLAGLYEHLTINTLINAGRKIKLLKASMKCSGNAKPCILTFHDSHCLIPKRLADFGEMFKLKIHKEVMPYDLYSRKNVITRILPIKDAYKFIAKTDKNTFDKNIIKWKLNQNGCFDILEYSRRYCEIDCEVLRDGYLTFRDWILEITGLDIDNSITLPSLVKQYYKTRGCFDGVFEFSGSVSIFIRKCLVGGRCATRNGNKVRVEGILNDLDAVSLYASAMVLFKGMPKGEAKIITDAMIQNGLVESQDSYFVKILVESVGKNRIFPLGTYKDENDKRVFSNDLVGRELYVDRYALEDLVEFQQIEYTIQKGYYFDCGFNTKICEVVKDIVARRKAKKNEGNPIQEVYKLFANSGYGMLIRKDIDTQHTFFTDLDKFNNFLSYRYNDIFAYQELGKNYMVSTYKPVSQSYSFPHCGAEILSMSKRMMNRVMCSAEDAGIPIFYQDTDSMHLPDDRVKELNEVYKLKYGTELLGGEIGQFHCDFSTSNRHYIKGSNIVSKEFIALGKKVYIDHLLIPCRDKKGNEWVADEYHIRMKGINNKSILATASRLNMPVLEMYRAKFEDSEFELEFNLLDGCLGFQTLANFSYTTRSVFKRSLSNKEVDSEYHKL